jgi:hypothetical protein
LEHNNLITLIKEEFFFNVYSIFSFYCIL